MSNLEDDIIFWANVASNILAWTNWGEPVSENFDGEDDIFQYYIDHGTNEKGYPQNAWRWWFDGVNQSGVNINRGGFWDPPHTYQDFYYVE